MKPPASSHQRTAKKVRTRFAPSPTGFLHVGGVRTALFGWLLARQTGGVFILRLEDTDKKREVEGADQHIQDTLKALGVNYDEGPDVGGPYGPYKQSERLDSYKKWAEKLIKSGRAYADPTGEKELDKLRSAAQAAKKPFLNREHRPKNPPVWTVGQPLRFLSEPKAYTWQDEVMGTISTGPEVVDDFILVKADGYPTYNFSHIIDDADMAISHIIRGSEFLPSVPNYLNLYEALGLKRPMLATVPPVLGPSGNKKLSKRDGAKDILDYIKDGYLPDALINFIASLGWNDGTEQEIYSREELISKFRLGQVQRSGARFDNQRLIWMNGHYIRQLPLDELSKLAADFWPEAATEAKPAYKKALLALLQDRLKFLGELSKLSAWFFTAPETTEVFKLYSQPVDEQLAKQPVDYHRYLQAVIDGLSQSDFSADDIQTRLNRLLEKLGTKPAVLFPIIRIAISGQPQSPEIFGSLSVLGKTESLKRLQTALAGLAKTG
ncbi:glutamate--tRNA ligase [Candidatus Saccharibacteria bacterium]|nr:glutamate--tRNA ligase [Candidatus Saccharibacteria bacterium]